jgi:endonuclease/exonuclease/phosphatase family metal-dependent hydrolase
MTFNIRVDTFFDLFNMWANRRDILIQTILDNDADVICLQEALNKQIRDIRQGLPEYTSYAAGRNNGIDEGESCAIFFRKDRFILADSGTFWFSDTPERPGSKDWGNFFPRICSWVHLIEKRTRRAFYVYNVHLDNWSQNSRTRSIGLLTRAIAGRREDDPFMVMGDFNMGLDNPAMRYLQNVYLGTKHPQMTPAWQRLYPDKPAPGTHHGFTGRSSGKKIDHIEVCENIAVLDVHIDRREIEGRYPSDHFPVIAEVLLY